LTSGVIFWWIRSKWVCTLNEEKDVEGLGTKEKNLLQAIEHPVISF
jgi:hypothetical protein